MENRTFFNGAGGQRAVGGPVGRLVETGLQMPRQAVIGFILILALLAFEMFNFDTTQYALENLLGDIKFIGLGWATILAVAFCAIDFAGLARLFTPERGADEPKEVWYLMGAWLLGATMNALMTWWAVSLTLINHQLGNEVLSREQLIKIVPVFVALLVWLTRILFIGSVTMAGERLLAPLMANRRPAPAMEMSRQITPQTQPAQAAGARAAGMRATSQKKAAAAPARQAARPVVEEQPEPLDLGRPAPQEIKPNNRVRQRPPQPNVNGGPRTPGRGVQAYNQRRRE
ncbi:MAG: hypothetical protein L0332_10215 [Chloroflexi bacterium]|nr:hypothetical protein [Chloroflexota bacterium]MCI0575956.1 hypothetical protein [Chloroflexota bacterium]MCI0649398.1 hypothetical protein [Chloroflexota bacterium]MCI0727079.1 hypothetical protein [Chloroflexota bacterium]